MSTRTPRPKNPNYTSPEEAAAFKKLTDIVAEEAAKQPARPVEVFASEKSGLGLKPVTRRVWREKAGGRSPEQQIGAATIKATGTGVRFFFNVTLDRPELARHLTTVHQPRKAPVVLNQEEMARLHEAAPRPEVQDRIRRRLWRGLTQGQRRPCQSRPIEGDVGDRTLPHLGGRRPC